MNNYLIYSLLCGAISMGCWVAGLFFYRFWRQTSDPFFQLFAWSFWIMGVERLIPIVFNLYDEPRTFVYVIRFVASALIVVAIVVKNKSTIHPSSH